jgi:lactate racemase
MKKRPPPLPDVLVSLVDQGASLLTPTLASEQTWPNCSVEELCQTALAHPIGTPRLQHMTSSTSKVVIIISDDTREEPRVEMFQSLREELAHVPDRNIAIMIASGTHAPHHPNRVLPPNISDRYRVVVHDGHDPSCTKHLGTTHEGTHVRIHHEVAGADVVVATGRIRPHYFAGFSGGAKSIFPGCALATDARQNHLLKADKSADLGQLDTNRCRLDMEAACALVPGQKFLLNLVADYDGNYVHACAGHWKEAHREACAKALPLFEALSQTDHRFQVVITADLAPVTSSLYQASKLIPPARPLLLPGGHIILMADCEAGTGPLATVNDGIYRLGIEPKLPQPHTIQLVSTLPADVVRNTYAIPSPSLSEALKNAGIHTEQDLKQVCILWRAGELITSVRQPN